MAARVGHGGHAPQRGRAGQGGRAGRPPQRQGSGRKAGSSRQGGLEAAQRADLVQLPQELSVSPDPVSGRFSWLATPGQTRAVLEDFGLYAKHSLGQNFMVNDAVIGRILDLAQLAAGDAVFEVGPGIGTLTVALLRHAGAVVAVEADRDLPAVLAQTCQRDSERLALVQGDAVKVTPRQLSDALAGLGLPDVPHEPTQLVSNLPYQVAATVVLGTFEHLPSVRRAVVMAQAEVADRMCAGPGNRSYGAYTAKLGLWAHATGRFEVGPGNFMPAPHVNSAVVRIDRDPQADPSTGQPLTQAQLDWAERVIDAAFAQRRKTIRNSMGAVGFQKGSLDRAFQQVGIQPTTRAEKIGVQDFVRLSLALGAEDLADADGTAGAPGPAGAGE